MLRCLLIGAFFFTMTPLLIVAQWLLEKFNLPGWRVIATLYSRALCRLLRIRIRVVGAPVRDRAVLFVSNHLSWADILVIGALGPVAFVAKREVADWPLVGVAARLQRTVFVDRARRHQTGEAIGAIVKRLMDGVSVVLFAEGTSSDGNRVLPFRSALIGAVDEAVARGGDRHQDSADVDRLHRPAGHPDGTPEPPAGGVVWRSRFHAALQDFLRARRGRCGGQLRRTVHRRWRGRPQSDDRRLEERCALAERRDAARPAAANAAACRRVLKAVMNSNGME